MVLVSLPAKECGGVLTDQKRIIQSPGFPDEYQDEQICYWHIRVRLGQKIHLRFLEFDVEDDTACMADYLDVYDSYDDVSGFAGRWGESSGLQLINESISLWSHNFVCKRAGNGKKTISSWQKIRFFKRKTKKICKFSLWRSCKNQNIISYISFLFSGSVAIIYLTTSSAQVRGQHTIFPCCYDDRLLSHWCILYIVLCVLQETWWR